MALAVYMFPKEEVHRLEIEKLTINRFNHGLNLLPCDKLQALNVLTYTLDAQTRFYMQGLGG